MMYYLIDISMSIFLIGFFKIIIMIISIYRNNKDYVICLTKFLESIRSMT